MAAALVMPVAERLLDFAPRKPHKIQQLEASECAAPLVGESTLGGADLGIIRGPASQVF